MVRCACQRLLDNLQFVKPFFLHFMLSQGVKENVERINYAVAKERTIRGKKKTTHELCVLSATLRIGYFEFKLSHTSYEIISGI